MVDNVLQQILGVKRDEIAHAKQVLPLDTLRGRVRGQMAERAFGDALRRPDGRIALIAEMKRRSPSRGMLRERFDVPRIAQTYQDAGADALSILTDAEFFGGSNAYLRDAKQCTDLPVLRKEFIIDPYQVYESAWVGADALLLIVAVLDDARLRELVALTHSIGLEAVVEVHTEPELDRAVAAGARIVGINRRDLQTFEMRSEITEPLVRAVPDALTVVVESGIQTREDVLMLQALGVHAMLVGESLMVADDLDGAVRRLLGT